MEWKKGITKETREKREGNYSDLERLSMIRSDVAVMCGKGTERKTRRDEATSERASRRKGASVSVICAKKRGKLVEHEHQRMLAGGQRITLNL